VIALFDRRFLHSPYRDHLPADWLPDGESGISALVGDPAWVAEEFFRVLALSEKQRGVTRGSGGG
ncbi:MAG TPA: hypothetical protein VEG34_17365, partial [Thermoanaerobaculia bacterium]|nr:hypothetical protein [Thermoanaerobaculia bacterium]